MSVVATPPVESQEQRIILDHVSWETYEGLLAATSDRSSPRMAYDDGTLEIMSPSPEHEYLKHTLVTVAELAAEEWEIEFINLGSSTYRRSERKQGASRTHASMLRMWSAFAARRELIWLMIPRRIW